MTVYALVRDVPNSFSSALSTTPPVPPLSATMAREQQLAYAAALQQMGARVVRLPADEAHPDCCFVEDMAVVVDRAFLSTRSGAPTRRGEAAAVADALVTGGLTRRDMSAPATLDGGDVLQVGRTLWVGRSGRTSEAGVEALRRAAVGFRVREVAVRDGLHLKSSCSSPADGLILARRGAVNADALASTGEVLFVPDDEPFAANAVGFDGQVLLPAHAPRTRALLEARGLTVHTVDNRELARADSALTCLSVLWRG